MTEPSLDCVCLGEVLIDLVQIEGGDSPKFEANVGGAPANVAAALALWGHQSAFLGRVGNDSWGKLVTNVLRKTGLSVEGFGMVDRPTTMAVVTLGESGERSFEFHREMTADTMLAQEDLAPGIVESGRVFHFGTLSLTTSPLKEATETAVIRARTAGRLVSFDPNLRPTLWSDREAMRNAMIWGLGHADIVKVSEEELEFLTGVPTSSDGPPWSQMEAMLADFDLSVLLVTAGSGGAFCLSQSWRGSQTPLAVEPVDTTGAGDCFVAGFLHALLTTSRSLPDWIEDDFRRALSLANAAGSLTTLKRGAIPAIPSLIEISRVAEKALSLQSDATVEKNRVVEALS